ncbi:MAG: 2-hydroxychromene-2-carboxylate isomerase [Pseudomonadales bacterium]|nr:2-hydroxychromene-2-carboxylate isomerase [Pseudomonadales bacterium]
MTKTVDFYFDVGSPASYLAWTQLPELAKSTNAEISWKPMLLGGVFKATGNSSPATVAAKSRYNKMDMERFAESYKVPLKFNPFFPINTLHLMRGAVAYLSTKEFERYLETVFTALWANEKNLGDSLVIVDVLSSAGFDPAAVMAKSEEPQVKESLKQLTQEAVERGVFGAPTFFIGEEMFFGQDRLGQLKNYLLTA